MSIHKKLRLSDFLANCTIGNYFRNSDAISLGTDPRMSGTAQPKGLAAWPDRSCFGWSEKLGGVFGNSPIGSREKSREAELFEYMTEGVFVILSKTLG